METFSLDGLSCLPSQDAIAEPGNLKLRFTEGADSILEDRSRAYRLKGIWGEG